MIAWLNENSGAVTALATVALVAVTGWYVYLTKLLVRLQQEPRLIAASYIFGSADCKGIPSVDDHDEAIGFTNTSVFPLRIMSITCKGYGSTGLPGQRHLPVGIAAANGLHPGQAVYITIRRSKEPTWSQEYFVRYTVCYRLMDGVRAKEHFPMHLSAHEKSGQTESACREEVVKP
jgi:hypothetical protein